jgi:SAM-dependent methyltransferase
MSQTTDEPTGRRVDDPAEAMADRLLESVVHGFEMVAVAIGDRLGYFRALDGAALTSAELSVATSTSERYTREWLEQQAVIGYLRIAADGDARSRRYALAPGTSETLARPDALTTMAPLARMVAAAAAQWTRIADAARSGGGLGWAEYGPDMREAQADINAPPLRHLLADDWLRQALPDLHDRLVRGEPLRVADVGCGAGWAAIGLATRFPSVTVDAYDIDPDSVALARHNVDQAGLTSRVRVVEQDLSAGRPDGLYDLTLAVECIHDMAHPVPVLEVMREATAPDGTVLVIDEKVAEEFTAPGSTVERLMYGYSTLICLPDAMTGNPTEATGTVMRPAVLDRYAREAGFSGTRVLPVEHDMWRFYELVG